MKQLPLLLLLLLFMQPTLSSSAQGSGMGEIPWPERGIWPESPRARAFREVAMPSPALATGACEFSVPLYTVEVVGFSLPISLQYRSNGIRVEDDPCPVGFGWVLSPALRVTRQIMGRPDEYFQFVADNFSSDFFTDYNLPYSCITMIGASDPWEKHNPKRFDSEHDIFTVHLPDASLTLILHEGKFIGVSSNEYKIENDSELTYIRVTDPRGIVYDFSVEGEYTGSKLFRTEWLLKTVTLPSSGKIEFTWETHNRVAGIKSKFGPQTARYGFDKFFGTNNPVDGGSVNEYTTYGSKDLSSITFPGGTVNLTYRNLLGYMLECISVKAGTQEVYRANLEHDFSSPQKSYFLRGVETTSEGTYAFEYNEMAINDEGPGDWWGFHNGKNRGLYLFHPSIKLKGRNAYSKYPGDRNFDGADMSVDTVHMKANLLLKATFPTGGCVEWEYQTHKFAKAGNQEEWITACTTEPELSFGGGVRVSKITMSSGDSKHVKKYIYGKNNDGLAEVEALPLLNTFVTDVCLLNNRASTPGGSLGENDRHLTINRRSNYLVGMTGMTPIWYSSVTEVDAEGKTEYIFGNICQKNQVLRSWGKAVPGNQYAVFSKGPLMMGKNTYKGVPGNYSLVEEVSNSYSITKPDGISAYRNVFIWRRLIQLDVADYAPDYGEGRLFLPFVSFSKDDDISMGGESIEIAKENYQWFEIYTYDIHLQTEQLTSTVTVTHTDNGTITDTVEYGYIPGTGLTSSVTHTRGDDTMKVDYTYAYGAAADDADRVRAQMAAANVAGVPLSVSETFNGETRSYSLDMVKVVESQDARLFRPGRITQRRGSGPAWTGATYTYDRYGNLASRTDAAGVSETWTWGNHGRYPATHCLGNLLPTSFGWKFLVGLSSIDENQRDSRSYSYDTAGRLSEARHRDRTVEKYSYVINGDGNGTNTVTTTAHLSPSLYTTAVETYDGLGRRTSSLVTVPGVGSVKETVGYDAMGRPHKVSAPLISTGSGSPPAPGASDHTLTAYEPSPRALPVATTRPGEAWHASNRRATVSRRTNVGGASSLSFTLTGDGVTPGKSLTAGTLCVERATDEDGVWAETATDIRGLTVMRRDASGTTYFIHDGLGDLRYVLPPGIKTPESRANTDMQRLAYWYDYDSRGRCVLKKLPGVRAARYRYDPADRLVAEQSPNHPEGAWRVYGYDGCGRQAFAADCSATDAEIDAFASVCRTAVPSADADPRGYALQPAAALTLTTVWARYYDGYGFVDTFGLGDHFRYEPQQGMPASPWSANGLLTGLYTGRGFEAYYYDAYGNEIQRCASGYNVGRRSRRDFDFAGNPAAVVHDYAGTGYGLPALTEESVRDAAGRLTSYTFKFDGTVVASASMFPDAAGNLRSALLGGWLPVQYTYDVLGWPLTMTAVAGSDVFHESLMYDGGKNPCFNGNISSRVWHSGRYDYSYDASNRLVRADFTAPAGAPEGTDFSATYAYDARGNLTSLVRKGVTERLPAGAETFGTVADRSFTYSGNRLTRVNDYNVSVGPVTPVTPGMTPSAALYSGSRSLLPTGLSLSYDDAGRLTADETRGISSVAYNNDGLPTRVTFDDGARHTYIYDGLGRLVEAVYEAFVPVASNPALGQLVRTGHRRYTGDGHVISPDVALVGGATDVLTYFPGGYVDAAGRAHYHITDYRGSVMAVVRDDGAVVQRTDYYPYGMPWRPASSDNARLFEGKEYLAADGLDEYDYLARRYAPEFVHFTTPDPHAENTPWLSPYVPFAANPILHIDPSGMDCFKFDLMGHLIEQISNTESDIISINGPEGEIASIEMDYGSVEKLNSGTTEKGINVDGLKIRGDENATGIFEMFASYTDVEYTQIKMGQSGEKGYNVITTSHQEGQDAGGAFYLKNQYHHGYTIREIIHNHPSGNNDPSPQDMKFGTWNYAKTNQNITFKIFTTQNKYSEYHPPRTIELLDKYLNSINKK